jgi:hypothetical protein
MFFQVKSKRLIIIISADASKISEIFLVGDLKEGDHTHERFFVNRIVQKIERKKIHNFQQNTQFNFMGEIHFLRRF